MRFIVVRRKDPQAHITMKRWALLRTRINFIMSTKFPQFIAEVKLPGNALGGARRRTKNGKLVGRPRKIKTAEDMI